MVHSGDGLSNTFVGATGPGNGREPVFVYAGGEQRRGCHLTFAVEEGIAGVVVAPKLYLGAGCSPGPAIGFSRPYLRVLASLDT